MCRREGPGVERFARNNAGTVTVIGLGTQDDIDLGRDFIRSTGVRFKMLWDPSFDSWVHFGVTGQPAAILLSRSGEVIKGWRGAFPEAEVLRLARNA